MGRENTKRQLSILQRLSGDNRQKGFTLVEVVMVVIVIGLLTSIAIPTYLKWIPGIRLKSAARDLYSNMQLARIQALKDNVTVEVIFETSGDFDPGNDYYFFDTIDDEPPLPPKNVWDPGEFRINLNSYKSGIGYRVENDIPPDIPDIDDWNGNDAVTTNPTQISFSNRGTANSDSVFIENEDKTIIYAITVLSTGAIRLRKYPSAEWN